MDKDKEKALLEKWSKLLGEPTEESKEIENKILTSWSAFLDTTAAVPPIIEAAPTFVDIALDNAKIVTQPVFSPVEKQPQLPEKSFVSKSVDAISRTSKSGEAIRGTPNDPIRNELNQIKTSITDLHHFASRISGMGGGGEVNLRYLDDVDRSTITDGYYLKYNQSSKKFVFSGVDLRHLTDIDGSTITDGYYLKYNQASNNFIFDTSRFISTYYTGANVALSNTANAYIVPPGVSVNGTRHISIGSNSNYIISETGNYVIDYSLQFQNTSISDIDIYVWLRKNTADIADSSSAFSVPARKTSNDPGKLIAAAPLFVEITAGDTLQLMMASPENNTATLVTFPALTANSIVPTIPRTPATIISIRQVN